MDTPSPAARLVSFTVGDWLVEPKACRLSRGDTVEKLRPQLVDVLVCLASRAGEIVLRDEILAEVWPSQYIAESGLSRCVAELRQSLQDDAQEPRFIETFPKRGYRLIAPVVWLDKAPPADTAAADTAAADTAAADTAPDQAEPVAAVPDVSDASPLEPAPAPAPAGTERPSGRRTRAWLGAALAVVVIGIVVVVMMTGSSALVLTEQDTVLLAFENRTGDAVFDETVPLAMSIQMEQSPYLGLLSPGRIQETLRMMQRPPDTPLTRAVGMDICERVGARALIVTSMALLGRQYAIGLEAVACGTGRVLARRQVTTDRKEQVLDGLQRAAVEIRRAVGEPAASLERYNVPIVEATTSSLEALRALRRGDVARERGETRLALDLYREAVALDPDFALALSRRGSVTQIGGTEAECRESLERAFALRQRVTLPERLEIEASYHRYVTGDQAKVVDSLELLTRTYPRRALFRRGLAVEQLRIGRYEAALAEALEAQRLEPNSAMNLATVGSAYLYLNRIADARATAEQALALGGVHPWLHVILLQCGLAADDRALLARERVWAAEHPDVATSYTAEVEAEEAMSRGRLQDAIGFLRQYEVWATSSGGPLIAARLRLWMAWFEALAGHRAQALHRFDDEIRRGLLPELKIDTVDVLVASGEFERAARVLDGIEGARPVTAQPEATFIRAYRAAIDASQGRTDQALARLAPLEPFDLGFDYGFIPLFERARVYYVAGNWTMARVAFEKILAHPTISGRHFIPLAQLGLARTLARSGDAAGSRRTYEQLFERWKNADPDLPVLGQARREYKALAK